MANVFIDDSVMSSIANAIRSKSGTTQTYLPSEMPSAIENIPSGGGGSDLPENWVIGQFTPQTDIENYTVTHNKGKAPFLALVFADNSPSVKNPYGMLVSVGFNRGETIASALTTNNNQGSPNAFSVTYTAVSEMSENTVTFASRGGNYTYKTGVTYSYLLVFSEV